MSPFQGSNHLWGFLTQRCAPSGRLRWAIIVAHIHALAATRPRLKPSDALQRLGRVGLMRNMWGSRRCLIGRRCPITPSALYNNTLKSASARDNNSPMRAPVRARSVGLRPAPNNKYIKPRQGRNKNNTLKSASARDNNSPMRAPCKGAKRWEWHNNKYFRALKGRHNKTLNNTHAKQALL